MAAPMPIPESAWKHLHIFSVRKSVVTEGTKAKTRIFDLRIFPVVEAPDAVERLDGMTFVEALQICVVDDPQAAVLNKRVVSVGGTPAAFGYNWDSHRAVWSVDHGCNCGAEGVVGFLRKFDDPIKYNRELVAKSAVARRFARLIDFLATGQLVAEGIPARGSSMVAIPRSIWRRSQTYLNLLNGDILELDSRAEDHTTALMGPTFTGLMLSKSRTTSETFAAREIGSVEGPRLSRSTQMVVTKVNVQAACVDWLSGLMRASPMKKTQTKTECWQQAQINWPGKLGLRGFERAWSEAVRETPAWSASGRPAKSPQA